MRKFSGKFFFRNFVILQIQGCNTTYKKMRKNFFWKFFKNFSKKKLRKIKIFYNFYGCKMRFSKNKKKKISEKKKNFRKFFCIFPNFTAISRQKWSKNRQNFPQKIAKFCQNCQKLSKFAKKVSGNFQKMHFFALFCKNFTSICKPEISRGEKFEKRAIL